MADVASLFAESKEVQDLVEELQHDLQVVEETIHTALICELPCAEQILRHLGQSQGKRLRPLLTLLSARLFGQDLASAVKTAAGAELIHMATLAHDDVIDEAPLRRGRPTLNSAWDNQTAVLTGDVLLAKALVLLVETGEPLVLQIMSQMISGMCQGEIAQNVTLYDVDQTEADYVQRIEQKTALFFAACCQAGSIAGGASRSQAEGMFEYGRLLGLAFQMTDDLLDLSAEADVVGKLVGSDLREGVLTLPVIFALQQPQLKATFQQIIGKGSVSRSEACYLVSLLRRHGGLEYTKGVASLYAEQAQALLVKLAPASSVRQCLLAVPNMVMERGR